MGNHTTGTVSPWMAGTEWRANPLREDTSADVVVVGAGIAGLSVAYELAVGGRSVVVVDDGPIGGGETSRTTAHLVTALDCRYYVLEGMHGAENAHLAAQSHGAAIDRIEAIVSAEEIDCGFVRVDGYLIVPESMRGEADRLVEREQSAAARAGVSTEGIANAPGLGLESGPCLRFPGQAQFHPMHYLRGLAGAIEARGGRVFTGTHAQIMRGGNSPEVVTSDGFRVGTGALVIATNTPVNDVLTMHTKQAAVRSYVVGLSMPRGAIEPALYWDGFWDDRNAPYHYVRLLKDAEADEELLIVGGEDHHTGRDNEGADVREARLEAWARRMFPMAGETRFRWSGQIMEPYDELAFIGRNPGHEDHVFIVTGDSGNGMTHAAIGGLMLPRLIAGQDHPWKELYSPSRLPTSALGRAAAETVGMASEYRDLVTPHPKAKVEELKVGEGVVARIDGRLCAVHKAADGTLVERSAICPHLCGVVRWNSSERSWDCPCHGSRFDCEGRVINGPANADLSHLPPKIAGESHREAPVEKGFSRGSCTA